MKEEAQTEELMMAETTNKEGQSDEIVAATSEDIAQERVSTTM